MKKSRSLLWLGFYIFIIAIVGCSSTKARQEPLDDEEFFRYLDESDDFINPGESCIFIRLYDPKYKSPFYMTNRLKIGIKLTEVNSITASHASIGFDLHDNFYGLTLMGDEQLKVEHITDIGNNAYLKMCNPKKSTQITYAIKVTDEEREKAKAVLRANRNARYDTGKNFEIAGRSIRRKFFTKKENKSLANFSPSKEDIESINARENEQSIHKFVCSAFIAYILYNSVQSVRDFFNEHRIDYHLITVTDIASIPGVERLFSSKWDDYLAAAADYVSAHAEFTAYFAGENDTVFERALASSDDEGALLLEHALVPSDSDTAARGDDDAI